MDGFLKYIDDRHQELRIYSADEKAEKMLKDIKKKLRQMLVSANLG